MPEFKKNQVIRTRFAPSPTGKLHIGSARTAVFNYLLAKKHNGSFVLRVEDTDEIRNIKDSEIDQENELKFLKIFPDESVNNPGSFGPYRQSQKKERYLTLAKQLVHEKKAYYCFCSEQELSEFRELALKNNSTPIYSKKCLHLTSEEIEKKLEQNIPHTIRLKTNIKEEYSWEDLIRGKITVPSNSISDTIIIRSNNSATYNFAVVVDDSDMEITHILRGEEHIANTPYQLAAYHALNIVHKIPSFGHISMIVNDNREKLSKRNSSAEHFVSTLIEKGFCPEAIFNFLILLGWSHGEEEIFDIDTLIKVFDTDNISSSPTILNIDKLNWISHKYFQKMEDKYYWNFVSKFFTIDLGENNEKKEQFAVLNKNRIVCATELNDLAEEYFKKSILTENMIEFLKSHKEILNLALKNFPENEVWDSTTVRNYLKQLMEISGLKGVSFFKPLRIAFYYREEGPSLNDLLILNGMQLSKNNLENTIQQIN